METLFFWASKLLWAVFRPDFLLVAFSVAGLICLYAGAVKRAGRIFMILVLAMTALTFLPIDHWVLSALEQRFPANPDLPEKVDGVILLGGAEMPVHSAAWDQVQINGAGDRYIGFIRLMHAYPDAACLFTGGSGRLAGHGQTCARVAREIFNILVPDRTIHFEDASRNTYENAKLSKALINPEPGQTWVLVTTGWHMPRAIGAFNAVNWKVIPYPVDFMTRPDQDLDFSPDFSGRLDKLTLGIKEWVGLAVYYLTGRTDSFFPG